MKLTDEQINAIKEEYTQWKDMIQTVPDHSFDSQFEELLGFSSTKDVR